MSFNHIGSISHGTLRTEDLLDAFADVLEELLNSNPDRDDAKARVLIDEARNVDAESEEAGFTLEDLENWLQEFAPDYFYFGAHPGDGADFGFWLHEDWQQMAKDDGVLFLNAGDPTPQQARNVAFITDHGNVTYGYVSHGEFVECWSIV